MSLCVDIYLEKPAVSQRCDEVNGFIKKVKMVINTFLWVFGFSSISLSTLYIFFSSHHDLFHVGKRIMPRFNGDAKENGADRKIEVYERNDGDSG